MILFNIFKGAEDFLASLKAGEITPTGVRHSALSEWRKSAPVSDRSGARGSVALAPGGANLSDAYNSLLVGKEEDKLGIHSRGDFFGWGDGDIRDNMRVGKNTNLMGELRVGGSTKHDGAVDMKDRVDTIAKNTYVYSEEEVTMLLRDYIKKVVAEAGAGG